MSTTLDLTTLPRTSLRLLVASCAADPRVDVPATQRKALWDALGDHTWAPTADDSPVPLATVQAWLDGTQGPLRQWLERHVRKERT